MQLYTLISADLNLIDESLQYNDLLLHSEIYIYIYISIENTIFVNFL